MYGDLFKSLFEGCFLLFVTMAGIIVGLLALVLYLLLR